MTLSTRTFSIALSSTTTNVVTEIVHFRDEPLLTGEKAAVYLEACFCNVSLKSFQLMKFPNYEGDESEAERLAMFTAAELASQKVGLRVLSRKNNTGVWREKAEIILTNAGRKSYFDLLIPYLAKAQVRLLEYNDALGIQLIDYGNGLLKQTDFIEIEFATTVDISKKNDDFSELSARIASLELALEGRLVNVPANSLLGRGGGAGTVERLPLPLETDKGGFGVVNTGIYGSVAISAILKSGWGGIHFQGAYNANYLMHNPATGDIGFYAAQPGAPFWRWYSSATEFFISQPLKIGVAATAIKSVRSHAQVVDFPSIASQGLFSFDIPVAGAMVGAYCHVVPVHNNPNTGYWALTMTAIVQVAGTVSILVKNDTSSAVDAAPFWIRILIMEF